MLLDPNFRRTVVLLLEHTEEGAIGVVLNRPSDTEAREAVPDLRAVLTDDEPIFLGGPVQPETVIALADHAEPEEQDETIVGSIASLEFDDDVDHLHRTVNRARVFAGYAGWSTGQLEDEIDEEASRLWKTARVGCSLMERDDHHRERDRLEGRARRQRATGEAGLADHVEVGSTPLRHHR